jgi:hypothetical protein
MVSGANQATDYGHDFFRSYNGVSNGNHVVTVITYEPTGNFSIKRIPGLLTQTTIGLGFGDMNASGSYTTTDIRCSGPCSNNSVEDVLYSQNNKFRAAFDVNGDGLGDNRDLFALGQELISRGASQSILNSYTDLLLFRGDMTGNGTTDVSDMAALYNAIGSYSWQTDLHVESNQNVVNIDDVKDMVFKVFRTVAGDFNLDGSVNAADYVVWRKSGAIGADARFHQGDGDFDGDVDSADLALWKASFGFVRQPLAPGSGSGTLLAAVPEPTAVALGAFGIFGTIALRRRTARARFDGTTFGNI